MPEEPTQVFNQVTGRWEPPTVNDQITYMSIRERARFISKTFCHGFGEEQIYKWLKSFENIT